MLTDLNEQPTPSDCAIRGEKTSRHNKAQNKDKHWLDTKAVSHVLEYILGHAYGLSKVVCEHVQQLPESN